jgi:predicted RNA-binding protein (virulence factor B family)
MNVLTVRRIVEPGAVLGRDDFEVLLPRKEVPPALAVDDVIEVFLYRDSEDRPIATTRTPRAQAGRFACLEVKDVTRFGAFLDWGLDKDLLLPFAAQAYPIRERGRRIVVYVSRDPISGRMMAATKFNRRFASPPADLRPGQPVELLPYERTDLGFNAIVDQSFKGLIHHDDAGPPPSIGETVTGYVQRIREDGLVDLSLRPSGLRASRLARDEVLEALRAAGGRLDLGDASPPEAIRERLGISKKAFKKAIGGLYREGLIAMTDDSIRLRDEVSTRASSPQSDPDPAAAPAPTPAPAPPRRSDRRRKLP